MNENNNLLLKAMRRESLKIRLIIKFLKEDEMIENFSKFLEEYSIDEEEYSIDESDSQCKYNRDLCQLNVCGEFCQSCDREVVSSLKQTLTNCFELDDLLKEIFSLSKIEIDKYFYKATKQRVTLDAKKLPSPQDWQIKHFLDAKK